MSFTQTFRKRPLEGTQSKNQPQIEFTSKAKVSVKFQLITASRFEVYVFFNAKLISLFKTIPSRSYNPEPKRWNFALLDHNFLVSKVRALGSEYEVKSLPSSLVAFTQNFTINKIEFETIQASLGPKLSSSLKDFQKAGIQFGIERGGKVLIADDMGLGKTLQALGIAAYYRQDWPILIICPSSVRFTWADQCVFWVPWVAVDDLFIIMKGSDEIPKDIQVVITSYDLMVRKKVELLKLKFKIVIFDESHFLKNHKTARSKNALPLAKEAKRVILLSGTPALARPSELYVQISAICPLLFPKFYDFGVRYCELRKTNWGWNSEGCCNETELLLVLEHFLMIRRTKVQVLHELPSKLRQIVYLDENVVSNPRLKEINKVVSEMANNNNLQRSEIMKYFVETGRAKIQGVCDYLKDLLEGDAKILIFAHHVDMLNGLETFMQQNKVDYIRIDGAVRADARYDLVYRFQNVSKVRVAILSITAANTGITLTAATLVIFAELFWSPGVILQAEDRAYRIGQRSSVTITYLLAKNTADDFIYPLIKKKLNILGKCGLSDAMDFTYDENNKKEPKESILKYFETKFIDDTEIKENIPHELSATDATVSTDPIPGACSKDVDWDDWDDGVTDEMLLNLNVDC